MILKPRAIRINVSAFGTCPVAKTYRNGQFNVVNFEAVFLPFLANRLTLVFQSEEVCGINVVTHKMKNVSGGI